MFNYIRNMSKTSFKVLDTEELEQIKKEEFIKYFLRIVSDEPDEYDDFFSLILLNDYFKINIDLDRLLKLLKPLIKDKDTDITLLKQEIFNEYDMSFVHLNEKPERLTGDLYIKSYLTEQDKEDNIITLSTNFFKVKLNPDNETHIIFMKKMIDMRSSPILKKTEGNDEEDIKKCIELLKLTFNMKSNLRIKSLSNQHSSHNFNSLLSANSLLSKASLTSTSQSSLRDIKSTYFEKIERLKPKYFNLYDELIEYFHNILLRNDDIGLQIYNDFYNDFLTESGYFETVYILWDNIHPFLDKYVFDSVLEDITDNNLEEDPENKLPDVLSLQIQTIIPKKQKQDIINGKLLFLTKELCLRLNYDNDIDFFEELPLIFAKDIYQTEQDILDYKFLLEQIYKPDIDYNDYYEPLPSKKIKIKYIKEQDDDEKTIINKITKFLNFALESYPILLEENPQWNVKNLDEDVIELTQDLIRIYSAAINNFKKFADKNLELLVYLINNMISNPSKSVEKLIEDIYNVSTQPSIRKISKLLEDK